MISALAGDEPSYRRLLADVADRLRVYFARRLSRESADVEDLVSSTVIPAAIACPGSGIGVVT